MIRPAVAGDVEAVWALARGFGFAGVAGTAPDAAFRARYAAIVDDPAWALLVAGDLSGYALAQDQGPALRRAFAVGRLHDLYVSPPARRRGTGRALVAAVEAWCRARPYPIVLDWQARTEAVPFYTALGYVPDYAGDTAEHPAFCLDLRELRLAP